MKKYKLLLAASLVAGALFAGGCAESASTDKILRIGTDDTYPPFEFRDESNKLVGFEVDLAREIGEELGMEVEFISTAWAGIFNGLNARSYDVIMSATSITPERLKSYLFTEPHMTNGQVIVTRKGDKVISSPEELEGLKVGVQLETTADIAATKYSETVNIEMLRFDEVIQTFSAMKAGHVDVIVADYAVAIDYVQKDPASYQLTEVMLTNEPIAITLRKDDQAMQKTLNDALDTLRKDGTLKDLSIRWLGEDYTSSIDTELKTVD